MISQAKQVAMIIIVAGFLTGCDLFKGKDSDPNLDELLEQALANASNGQGMASFQMPESDDFASIPQDPLNPITQAKVDLGQLLYHETGLMVNNVRPEGQFSASCASCHHAGAGFQAGRVQGVGEGGIGFGVDGAGRVNNPTYEIAELDVQPLRSPTAMNGAWQQVMLWNGQFGATGPNTGTEANWTPDTPIATNHLGYEGLEIQAIAGLAVHRMGDIDQTLAATDDTYKAMFAAAFPGGPIDRENAGLAIAAYERTILANQSPFQRWLAGNADAMSDEEKRGAVLFFGDAGCADCHGGPALNSMTFYALGFNDLDGPGVYGDFDANAAHKGRGSFTGNPADDYKFKTPQLYNLTDSPHLGHGGTFKSVREVVEYKNAGVSQNANVPAGQLATQFMPLGLTDTEVAELTAFIETGLYDPNLSRYVPNSVPSGNCFPNNDSQAQADLGCN